MNASKMIVLIFSRTVHISDTRGLWFRSTFSVGMACRVPVQSVATVRVILV